MSGSLAAIFNGPAQGIELRRLALPTARGETMLVRVLGCTLCGSDLHTVEGRRTVAVPTILGHEIVGELIGIGESATAVDVTGEKLRIGDRITWSIVANCGECFYCARGLPQKCERAVKYGHEALQPGRELTGGLAEHCLLAPGTKVVKLPAELPLEVACPANCATATVAAAVVAAGNVRDRTVCILGAGLLGLTACAMCHSLGASQVICVDIHPARLERANAFGASQVASPAELAKVIQDATGGHGVDVALEFSGASSAFEAVLPQVRLGGRVVLVGSVFPGEPVPIQLEQIVRRNLSIIGIHNYAPEHLLAAVQFLAANHERYPFADLVAVWKPLEEVGEAFEQARDASKIRVGVRPGAG